MRYPTKFLTCAAVAAVMTGLAGASRAQEVKSPTLDAIKKRGELICGVDTGIPGFAFQDASGKWDGLDVAYCRAIATSVLGNADKVKYVGTTSKVRFSVLQSGEIDVLIRDSTHTLTRNTELGLAFGGLNFFTGEAFMVKKSLNVAHAKDLNGATICVLTGTTLELNIADYGRANNIKINTLLFEKPEEAFAAAEAGRCDGYTDDGGSVAAARSAMKNPKDWVILPELISREFLGAYTRQGDERWTILVNWVHYAMLEAEVLGITKANVDKIKGETKDPETRSFLGLEANFGKQLGVDNDWAYRIVKSVGNYGENYDTYFGPLELPRGWNNLYNKGGLQYPLPWR
ncbi:MAG: amino acid ABC transporter substrate-binding protein [Alphaproteobacteria bacterium]|nr:amino acid ABC transporter substrate-binding protein [Alphaproteobacteria bacterium]